MASIYNSSDVSEKAGIIIVNPFSTYREFDNDRALAGGFLYFGLPGQDGEVEENRKRVYAILENGAAVSIPQPVLLSAGGVPEYNGNPVQLATDGSYSLKVKNQYNVKEYFAAKVVAKSLLGYSGIIPEEVKGKSGDTLKFDVIEASTASFYIANGRAVGTSFNGVLMQKDVDYSVVNESTIRFKSTYVDGSAVLGRTLDPTGQTIKAAVGTVDLSIFSTQAEAVSADLSVGSSVIINGKDDEQDGKGGSYIVTEGVGTDDGYNFINIDNGNQLKIKNSYQSLQGLIERVTSPESISGKFTLDVVESNVFDLKLTENASSIDMVNIAESGEVKIEIKVTQDSATPYTFTWLINGKTPKTAGGSIPTMTETLEAVDRYVLLTDDGGNSFELYVAGQDIK